MTAEQIKAAVTEGRAVIRWSHGNWKNIGSLLVCRISEDAEIEAERDTRGECWSMADEVWSELATDAARALRAGAGTLSYS
jgi:hypothetical protein